MDPTLKLLTLINVSAARPGKRQRTAHLTHYDKITRKAASASASAAAAASSSFSSSSSSSANQVDTPSKKAKHSTTTIPNGSIENEDDTIVGEDSDVGEDEDQAARNGHSSAASSSKKLTAFDAHFANEGPHAVAISKLPENVDEISFTSSKVVLGGLATEVVKSSAELPGLSSTEEYVGNPQIKVLEAFNKMISNTSKGGSRAATKLHKSLTNTVGTYQDLVHTHLGLNQRQQFRQVLAMHAMSHVAKTRRRVLKNNEKLAKLASSDANPSTPDMDGGYDPSQDVRDQGFTRPKVLILLPFRNSALEWVDLLSQLSLCSQVDNKSRFLREYNLPEGAVDKLADPATASKYPPEHIETFKGNIDDSFKLGMKVTRKSLKLFSGFYDSDIIVASPLGLRLGIEKDKGDFDFLSSIEMLIVDQTDVISMQNWDHLEFVLDRLNKIPKQTRDTDFSRVKQWYLDNRAPFFRQTVLLSAYDFPALRGLYNHNLKNIAGKQRTVTHVSESDSSLTKIGVEYPGIRHTFQRFPTTNLHSEPDQRFQFFTGKVLPQICKSAISSSHVLILIPSYFDFVRVEDYFRTTNEKKKPGETTNFSYTSISEYSKPKEITRARQSFFTGNKRFLLLTERAHFYRRFALRGVKTIVVYQLPQNPSILDDVLRFPFNTKTDQHGNKSNSKSQQDDDEEDQDPNEIQTNVIYSKYDLLQLESAVGSKMAKDLVTAERSTWKFV